MKLYFTPGACSLSPHIVLRELGLRFDLVRVDPTTKQTADGHDFREINPHGYVPALVLDDGSVLTEGPAIVQYLADQVPAAGLAPANGTFARYKLQEWLNFISTEIHKTFSPLFKADTPEVVKESQKTKLALRLDVVERTLGKQDYLLPSGFSVADVYMFTVLSWARFFHIGLDRWPGVSRFMQRVGERPVVKAAVEFETASKKAA